MGTNLIVTGMVLNAMPIGDYDKRITLLTKERGRITAFARGARRPNGQLLAAASPFSFGEFELFEGRSTYTAVKATISNYFRELSEDLDAAWYGFYFLEFADYFCQENNDEREMLKLLYQSLRALISERFSNRLVRLVFELKALSINGMAPYVFSCLGCKKKQPLVGFSVRRGGAFCEACQKNAAGCESIDADTLYTMQYVISSPVEKLYSFTVSECVLSRLERLMREYKAAYVNHSFKSAKVLEETEPDSFFC